MKRLAGIFKSKGIVLVLLALAILLSSGLQNNFNQPVAEKAKKEHTEPSDSDESNEEKVQASEAIVNIVSLSLLTQSYCIFSLEFNLEKPVRTVHASVPLGSLSYFRTLFNLIISPNAP